MTPLIAMAISYQPVFDVSRLRVISSLSPNTRQGKSVSDLAAAFISHRPPAAAAELRVVRVGATTSNLIFLGTPIAANTGLYSFIAPVLSSRLTSFKNRFAISSGDLKYHSTHYKGPLVLRAIFRVLQHPNLAGALRVDRMISCSGGQRPPSANSNSNLNKPK